MRDFLQGETQFLRLPDETKRVEIVLAITAIAGAGSRGFQENSSALIEADSLNIDGGLGGKFSDSHPAILNPIVGYGLGAARNCSAFTLSRELLVGVNAPKLTNKALENALLFSVRADSSSSDVPLNVTQVIAGFVVLIDGEGAGEFTSTGFQRYCFLDIGGADQVASRRIPSGGEVVQLVFAVAQALPHTQTEVAGDRRPSAGVHDLSAVAMPLRISGIDFGAVRDAFTSFGHKLDVPEAYDPRTVIVGLTNRDVSGLQKVRLSRLRVSVAGHRLGRTDAAAICEGIRDE